MLDLRRAQLDRCCSPDKYGKVFGPRGAKGNRARVGESEPPDRRGRRHGRPARVKPSSRKTSQSWPDGHATKTTTIRTPAGVAGAPPAPAAGAQLFYCIFRGSLSLTPG